LNDYNNGLNLKQICEKYKIGPETLNMVLPKEIRGANKLKGKKWTKDILEQVKTMFEDNISHQKIGEKLNLDHGTVKYILNKKLKIDTKKRDLRTKRPKGIGSKKIILIEENKIFDSISEAASILNISVSNIRLSLNTGKKVNKKYTFKFYTKDLIG
jgi:DNA invertase Pin-like site-specific DNA recombinase